MAIVFRLPAAQVVDANGLPIAGGKLYFYDRGTTTPKNVFSDEGLTTPISQPVIANSAGQWAQIFLAADRYRIQLYSAADALLADWDNHDPGQPVSATAGVLPLTLGGTGVTSLSALQSLLGLGAASTWTDVASAGTTDLGAVPSTNVRITGINTITSFGTVASGTTRQLRFSTALTLTHNATSLILPTAASIATAADDTAVAVSLGSGNWIVVDYQRTSTGLSVGRTVDYQSFTAVGAGTWNKPAGTNSTDLIYVELWGGGAGGQAGGGGAGGGGYSFAFFPAGVLGATAALTVGAGGTAAAQGVSATWGGNGGASSFSGTFQANGGIQNAGGTVPTGTTQISGIPGAAGGTGAAGSASIFSGGGGGSATFAGGNSSLVGDGGTGASGASPAVGAAGTAPGGGGGGGGTFSGGQYGASGAGARGEVRVWTIRTGT